MTKKLDHLGLCNDQGVPLEDFQAAFCLRCFQSECTRSQFGSSKFESRVTTWEQRLFHAPTLPKTDPRYPLITAKKFLTLHAGPAPTVREWIDPTALDAPPPVVQIPQAAPAPAAPPPPVVQKAVEPVPEKKVEPEVPVVTEKVDPPTPAPRQNLLVNTPYTGPRTLANQPESKEPPRDAWAAPAPLKPGEKVIRPGAKIKLGG